jgi:hypothetical protein
MVDNRLPDYSNNFLNFISGGACVGMPSFSERVHKGKQGLFIGSVPGNQTKSSVNAQPFGVCPDYFQGC